MGSKPTIRDVAREAGVSLGTVSKVINGLPVGKEYKVKVEKAVERMGYEVNEYARGLRAGKTYTVALILPGLNHPFFASLAHEVCAALAQRDHRMLVYVTASKPDLEQRCINMVRQNKVDGIIGLTYNPLELDEDLPFVSIDRSIASNIPCVAADNYGGGRIAAETLIGLGCRHLAFLRTGSVSPSETDRRGDGFESTCRMRNIPCRSLRLSDGDDMERFRDFFRSHMTDGKLNIDGVFCSTDLLAWNIKKMLEELGVRVPEDVQLIGFDGIQRFGGEDLYCSTIVQPVRKMAETAVDLLLAKDRSNAPALVLLPVSYSPGGTTKE